MPPRRASADASPLGLFHPPVGRWFQAALGQPTMAQAKAWPAIAAGRSTLLLAPTGSGKTLAAFLAGLDRLMFSPEPEAKERCRLLYISPLKALAVDIERNLRAPLAGIAAVAQQLGATYRVPTVGVRSGDTPAIERARMIRTPPDILITTPESLYLMLTSEARSILASVESIIVDEIHAMVASKRGAHLFVSLERLESLRRAGDPKRKPTQRIGLSATQRPLDEVARLLGGAEIDGEGVATPRPVEIADAGARKLWDLRVEVPVEDMARIGIEAAPIGREVRTEDAEDAEDEEGVNGVAADDADAEARSADGAGSPDDAAGPGAGQAGAGTGRVDGADGAGCGVDVSSGVRAPTPGGLSGHVLSDMSRGTGPKFSDPARSRGRKGKRGEAAPSGAVVAVVAVVAVPLKPAALDDLPSGMVAGIPKPASLADLPSGSAAGGKRSIWPSIHPRLVALIREHRSTMIFCNSRRLAERLAAAINETAGEELALAHHGSVARDRRQMIEERLKRGELPAIVATSSLELGIDIGAVDLVIQIEAPPSVASGIQRIGRAGHQVGAVSRGILVPKFRGDLLACAAATPHMRAGLVEESYYPRSPLDILAQQVVAALAMDEWEIESLYAMIRRAAPFSELPRVAFEGVLDMLSGRYPSDEFAELRPRIVWDRVTGQLKSREGAKRLAVLSGGTIPDRGLYGVFLTGEAGKPGRRVGELDEEMVFESRVGEVFVLGASSWRIEDITHDRVIVSPAPGQPGKMPFWHGDNPGRPIAFGRVIGALSREIAKSSESKAITRLREEHGLDERAAANLRKYLREQAEATGEVPSDQTVVIERYLDELGDYRVCLLTPFGARVHAPWAMAIAARLREESGMEVETMWSDDGIVLRFPAADAPPEVDVLLIAPDEIEDRVVACLGSTAVFAARFRENAARALLLPRRFPGKRSPLWAQRQRAADLLKVASRYGSFPIILETYRECLRDVFDLPALTGLLRQIAARELRVHIVDTRTPSPFASSLMFAYVANFIYEGDAPMAERRAQALAVDAVQLRELLGEATLRELLDPDALAEIELQLQRVAGNRPASSADGLHDLLLALGDLTTAEIEARCKPPEAARGWLAGLERERRVFSYLPVAALLAAGAEGRTEASVPELRRFAAAEDAGRLRDAIGVVPPVGLPRALMESVADAVGDLVSRYARTHGPFTLEAAAGRIGLGVAPVRAALVRLAAAERVLEGEFTPGGRGREWCDAGVLRSLKRRSLARLRREVEPVPPAALGRFLPHWQGVMRPRAGLEALLSVVEQLQGAPLLASALDTEILPARIRGYRPDDLDTLCSAGELRWAGLESVGPHDGRIALYLTDQWPLLARTPRAVESELAGRLRTLLAARGASFFADLAGETGAFPADLLTALWDLVWAGEVTNDTLAPLRKIVHGSVSDTRRRPVAPQGLFRSRRLGPPGSEGRWSLLPRPPVPVTKGVPLGTGAKGQGGSDMSVGAGLKGQGGSDMSVGTGINAYLDMSAGAGMKGQVRGDMSPETGADGEVVGVTDAGAGGVAAPVEPAEPELTPAQGAALLANLGPSGTARAAALARVLLERYGVLTREAVHAEDIAGGFSAVYAVLGAMEQAGKIRRGYFVAGLGGAQFALAGADERLRALREPGESPEICVLATTDPANPYGAALPWPERPGTRLARAAHTRVVLVDGGLAAYLTRDAKSVWTFLPENEPERSQTAAALARGLASLVGGQRRTLVLGQIDGVDAQVSPLAQILERVGFAMTSQGLFIRAQDDA